MEKIEILKLEYKIYKTVRDAIAFNDVKYLDEELMKLKVKIDTLNEIRLENLAGEVR